MPKYTIQWKDPDYYCEKFEVDGLDEEEYQKLRQLGFGEYLVAEFDTDTMTATVVGLKK